jgi:hypothetical protein
MPGTDIKHAFLAIVAAMFCTACSPSEQEAVWSTAIQTRPSDQHRIIHRFRSEFGPTFQRSLYPDRVIIAWTYPSDSGMPSTAEREAMDRMEDLLEPHVEKDGLATLVLVSTGEGLREWVYYTKSREAFMAKMNEAFKGLPRFPIEVDLWADPKWERYESFKAGVQNKGVKPGG